jgi:putative ABC transport system permease protein
MLSLQRTLSGRYLRRHWSRAVLVTLSIGLGVSALVATWSLNQSMTGAAHAAVAPLAGTADLLVTNGDLGVPRALVPELRRASIPGLREVRPLVFGRAVLPAWDNRSALVVGLERVGRAGAPDAQTLGLEVANDPCPFFPVPVPLALFANLFSRAGEAGDRFPVLGLPVGYPAYVGGQLAADAPPDRRTFEVHAAGRPHTLTRLGVVRARGPAASLGGNALYLRLDDAARVLDRPGLVSRIDLALEPGADRGHVERLVKETVGRRAEVRTPEAERDVTEDLMAGIKLAFNLGGVCALVVGLFLVYNALSVSVAERRHDIGILRAVGATRGQVAGLFAAEAGLLGLLGALLGVPFGWGLAALALGPLHLQETLGELYVPLETGPLPPLGADTVLVAVGAGVATALLAALMPALRAAGEEPADAVRRAPPAPRTLVRLLHAAGCGLLIGAGLAGVSWRASLPPRVGTFGGVILLLLGMLLATPLLAAAAARVAQPVARVLLGIASRLAADNLARSPGRTGLVIAALAAGVALLIMNAGVTDSSEQAILSWLDRAVACDLVVSAFEPATSSLAQEMDEHVGRLLETLPAVKKVVPVRFQYVDFRGTKVYLVALDAAAFFDPERHRDPVPGMELFPRLTEPGTVIVSENFAQQYHVRPGDTIALTGPHGPVEERVIGTMLDYSWGKGTVIMDRRHYRRQFGDDKVSVFDVYLRSGAEQARRQAAAALAATPQAGLPAALSGVLAGEGEPGQSAAGVRDTIARRWGAQEGLVVLTRDELRDRIRESIRRIYAIGYAQEGIVILVAALGVIMALSISVLQQRRQIGLLRAVGASRVQVLRTVLAEAALMGAVGTLIGLLFGIPLEWYALQVIVLNEVGFTFPVCVPWVATGVVVGLTLLIAILAGLLPALRAVRLGIADAIAYE